MESAIMELELNEIENVTGGNSTDPALEKALIGCAFRRDALSENLRTVSHGMDIFTLLQQEI